VKSINRDCALDKLILLRIQPQFVPVINSGAVRPPLMILHFVPECFVRGLRGTIALPPRPLDYGSAPELILCERNTALDSASSMSHMRM
jgi:hypothetical protein